MKLTRKVAVTIPSQHLKKKLIEPATPVREAAPEVRGLPLGAYKNTSKIHITETPRLMRLGFAGKLADTLGRVCVKLCADRPTSNSAAHHLVRCGLTHRRGRLDQIFFFQRTRVNEGYLPVKFRTDRPSRLDATSDNVNPDRQGDRQGTSKIWQSPTAPTRG